LDMVFLIVLTAVMGVSIEDDVLEVVIEVVAVDMRIGNDDWMVRFLDED